LYKTLLTGDRYWIMVSGVIFFPLSLCNNYECLIFAIPSPGRRRDGKYLTVTLFVSWYYVCVMNLIHVGLSTNMYYLSSIQIYPSGYFQSRNKLPLVVTISLPSPIGEGPWDFLTHSFFVLLAFSGSGFTITRFSNMSDSLSSMSDSHKQPYNLLPSRNAAAAAAAAGTIQKPASS
jgi:hypothetical protein